MTQSEHIPLALDRWMLPIQSPPFKLLFAKFSIYNNWAVVVGVGEAINEGKVVVDMEK